MMLTLEQISLITGLNDRTLRNYIHDGFLQGDKSSGKWLFTPQQYSDFINHPSIKPALKTKKMTSLMEFLQYEPGDSNWTCMVLNLGKNPDKAKALFMKNLKDSDYPSDGMLFEVDAMKDGAVQIVLSGPEDFVFDFMDKYRNAQKAWEKEIDE